jgi:uncharacterized membrane protein
MDDDNYKKAEKRAKRSIAFMVFSIILLIISFAMLTNGSDTLKAIGNIIASIIVFPMYITGFVLAINAKNTCKECETAQKSAKLYIAITVIGGIILACIAVAIIWACSTCSLECGGCLDFCQSFPG